MEWTPRKKDVLDLLVSDGFGALGPTADEVLPTAFERSSKGDARRVLRIVLLNDIIEFRPYVRRSDHVPLTAGPIRRHRYDENDRGLMARVRYLSGTLKGLPECPLCGAPMLCAEVDEEHRVFRCSENGSPEKCPGERPYVATTEDRQEFRRLLRRGQEGAPSERSRLLRKALFLAESCGMEPEAADARLLLEKVSGA